MNEHKRQSSKETAVLMALQHEIALIRRDLEIHGIKKDGVTELISVSTNYDDLWLDALKALKQRFIE